MKVIVFGATGGVGQAFVRQALEDGHEVTAFVRNSAKLQLKHDKLRVVQGDALNQEEVTAAIAGHDAVVSGLGSSQGLKKSTELQRMAQSVVQGMQANQVKRILYTASAGIDRELPGLSGKMVMALLKNVLADHRVAVEQIKSHDLDYTIARPMGLKNLPLTGKYREAATGVPAKAGSIAREDVAHFLLKAMKDPSYIRTSIGLGT